MIARLLAIALLFPSSLLAKTYAVDGIVVALDPVARTILVSHRPIANYMPAMAMPFRVADPTELAALHPGMRITFELSATRHSSIARKIRPTGAADETIPPPKERLHVGEAIPDVTLTDQLGRPTRLADLRGKVLAINFIYTRCPLPDVCPRLSASFAAIQRRLASAMGSSLLLLSITVDPDYDTSAILLEYAARWGADERGWRFLTGDVAKIAAALGEIYWTDEGSIGHNSSTAVVGRDGRIAAIVEGSTWRVEQLENVLRHELEKTK